jgi:hypothetical protein
LKCFSRLSCGSSSNLTSKIPWVLWTWWYATGTDIDDRKSARARRHNENTALREGIVLSSMLEEIVGPSAAIREVLEQVGKVTGAEHVDDWL